MIGKRGHDLFMQLFLQVNPAVSMDTFSASVGAIFSRVTMAKAQRPGEQHTGSCPTCGCEYLDPDIGD